MEVKITIEMGNEQFSTTEHLVEALRKLARQVEQKGLGYIPIMDINGNKVGQMEVE